MFHVKPVPWRQALQSRGRRVQRRHHKLRRQIEDLGQQSLQIASVELGGRVIHEQPCDTRAELRIAPELTEQQGRRCKLLLASGDTVAS
jgi:hypothetical protein